MMAQILDALAVDQPDGMACCYVNVSSRIQIARISNIPNWYFERVVFPGQRLLFEAVPDAQLEFIRVRWQAPFCPIGLLVSRCRLGVRDEGNISSAPALVADG